MGVVDTVFWGVGFAFCTAGGFSLLVLAMWLMLEWAIKTFGVTRVIFQWYADKLRAQRDAAP